MSYHGIAGPQFFQDAPGFTPTTAFAQAVDPYSFRFSPPGAVFSPYGWGPEMMIGMPASYTHHLDYVRSPIPGARPGIGPMYDELWPYSDGTRIGNYSRPAPRRRRLGRPLAGIIAVL